LTKVAPGASLAPPAGTTILLFNSQGIITHYGESLPYYPQIAPRPEAPPEIFADAWIKEFREGNPAQATVLYRKAATSLDNRVRAGALMRLARALSAQKRFDQALDVYGELAGMGDMPVGGDPSELVARRYRIALFDKTGDFAAKAHEVALLESALAEGRYAIDGRTFDIYAESLAHPPATRAQGVARTVEKLWPLWQRQPSGRDLSWSGSMDSGAFIAVWQQTSTGTAAMVASVDTFMESTISTVRDFDFRCALEDSLGRVAWGSTFLEAAGDARQGVPGLPWIIRVSADGDQVRRASAGRRNLLMASFGLMAVVITVASYLVFRALTREFRVAQLQSDFVSAVSHEFRTPLTAMRHLTDLLEEGGIPNDGLSRCYQALGKETRRLHAMVESLLDFARMESGRRSYELGETDVGQLVTELIEDFREQRHLAAHRLQLLEPHGEVRIRGDRDALILALRNLLDNAIKYSPESSTVTVAIEYHRGFAHISVKDNGAGIPIQEQTQIFGKFVRGTAAKALSVKGTGIGLAMAQQIVKAHGGRIDLTSTPSRGSRFTIILPMEDDIKV
jgi:signal transduction histidine kinase